MAPITIVLNKKCTKRQNTTKKGKINNKMCCMCNLFAMFFAHRFTFFQKKISEQDLISTQDLKFVKN